MDTMLAVAITSVTLVIFSQIISQFTKAALSARARSMLDTQSRIALEMMIPPLRKAIPNTAVFCACGGAACSATCTPPMDAPYTQIQFNTFDVALSTYTFFLKDQKIWIQEDLANRPARTAPRVIATNVIGLTFEPNTLDPGLVSISLQFEALGGTTRKTRVLLPSVMVRMGGD